MRFLCERSQSAAPVARGRGIATFAVVALVSVVAGCGGGSGSHESARAKAEREVQLSFTPASGSTDTAPDKGIAVTALRGRITNVAVHTNGDAVTGTLNQAGTQWQSTWALDVSRNYTVVVTAAGRSGKPVTRTISFRTLKPAKTVEARIIEGQNQTYGVGMPIILYFSQPVSDRAAVERALQVKTSNPVVGSWYWDGRCNLAAECLYFRPRSYWPAHTRVSFTGHLNGVQVSPGVYGYHTLNQTFTIGSPLSVYVSTSGHYMNVYRDGRQFAHWAVSSGKPGDDTPDGTYLTIEKANPVEMKGPGYDISVPYSVRITWSGDYLHDAYWSVGDQGFSNVSHGCVNMSPADAQTFYNMAVPGDPVKITGSPRGGTWDNGWTMWFMPWEKWEKGSALHEAVEAGPDGSTFVSPS